MRHGGGPEDGAAAGPSRKLSSAAVRVARRVPGGGSEVLPSLLRRAGGLESALILATSGAGQDHPPAGSGAEPSPPGRALTARRVGVADERGDGGAVRRGPPAGRGAPARDVMEGCPKAWRADDSCFGG
ncbi:MAG: hypothetical protein ACLR0P_06040 [Oscillospiraceae bacterium]